MKIKIKDVLLITVIFIYTSVLSQESTGIITYKASLNKEKILKKINDNKELSNAMRENILKVALDSEDINFTLVFNGKESIFSSISSKMKNEGKKKMNLTKTQADENSTYYTNLKTNEKFKKSSNFDGILISINPFTWEFTNETKKIGKFICKKATTTTTVKGRGGIFTRTITSWYTTDIPIPFGVQGFNGLPGLTLRLNIDDKILFEVTNIKLNPKEKIVIKRPKGKKISYKEFNNILESSRKRKFK
ncbi:GLPGLI family protein [Tenacibaculum finnmarkense genomovar finnmarkense]|uniref:GLPGLI family protein n=1 Tax=Tenacibaculum finnmarkense TaxID=2781243 RepID=UPI001E4626F0|nr:GLPGLI family protein [Tenacibaculum finnmarkense]MCD8418710.1 GLPGLI family protein [Tenacibaculum finnmarkense genomovar finnmarkense]MCG8187036.1 GLPGLI family protein [Tenacibaculum finnmarkense genomovar finnmarkense]MCG8203564.1 GLPGLI family protein [Tenacibaculum finnmarkense genomovar finnmarkense]MCG8211066.1 GLPGLI family protein [Tenacibaculum finnmarkense genomovar finnmarkense]MCG8213826.1 GLPGLI family protein [Tenacibaculum finnmarkense genomovar finnmarkense]